MALIKGVPPLTDWASMLAPKSSKSFTMDSWEREERDREREGVL